MDKLKKETKPETAEGRFRYDGIVFELPLGAEAKLIYIYLSSRAKNGNFSLPSHIEIQRACSVRSIEKVTEAIKELKLAGLLENINIKMEEI